MLAYTLLDKNFAWTGCRRTSKGPYALQIGFKHVCVVVVVVAYRTRSRTVNKYKHRYRSP